ncbi:MAG: sigma-54-dependent transcriptional regulator [Planctomycetota bacterium]|jgi:DNA-binding NtrC family response regulator
MSAKTHIVVIEDHQGNREGLVKVLTRSGYRVVAFAEAEPALEHMRQNRGVSMVLTDLMLPGTDGFGVLDEGVLMITGHASVESAVDAMKRGADDYLTKPVNVEELRTRVAKLLETHKDRERVDELEQRLYAQFTKLEGRSKAMQELFRQMELVAPARSNVLIVGESGTGKELVANALHEHSPRYKNRFLPINCAAIPAEILESELFGHERGAFTGASARKVGKFELADEGTLFLDEIGELPPEMQVKLLRVLEQREFMRVGGTETISVDIRLIAATNQDLEAAVEEGRLRSDLYYRLKVVTIKIPPLREREGDIPLLANHFLRTFAAENDRSEMRFNPDAMAMLVHTRWDGNVRELRNLVESLVVLAPGDEIGVDDLPPEYRGAVGAAADVPTAESHPGEAGEPRGETMDEIERRAILGALEKTGGNRTQAAEILGIGLRTLQRKLKEYRMAGKAEGV